METILFLLFTIIASIIAFTLCFIIYIYCKVIWSIRDYKPSKTKRED